MGGDGRSLLVLPYQTTPGYTVHRRSLDGVSDSSLPGRRALSLVWSGSRWHRQQGASRRQEQSNKTDSQWGRSKRGGSHDGDGVVVEDGGYVFRGEFICGVTDEKACLADRTVADDDAPNVGGLVSCHVVDRWVRWWGCVWWWERVRVLDCRNDHGEGCGAVMDVTFASRSDAVKEAEGRVTVLG